MPAKFEKSLPLLMGTSPGRRSSNTSQFSHPGERYVVYPARWVILATCCLLALSNSMQWISYTTLTSQTNDFYCQDPNNENCKPGYYTNQIFQFVAVITGLGGMYITDHYGIRLSLFLGVMLNFVGSIIRLVSSAPVIDDGAYLREVLLHGGSVIVAAAQAFFLVLPSKIAECWFPENQRAISNVLTFIANPMGVALGTLVPTFIFSNVQFDRGSWLLFTFNTIMCALAACTAVISLTIKRSLPPTPPSPSNAIHENQSLPFFVAIKSCLSEKQFLIQMITFGIAFAQLWGVMVILPDILAVRGYNLSGGPAAICAIVGVATSLVAGTVADRTKRFKEIIQVCSCGFLVTAIILRVYLTFDYKGTLDDAVILLLSAILGAFSIPQFPIGVEMGVETTFPVYEATSSGLLVISGQLCMLIISWAFDNARKLNIFYKVNENDNVGNWQLSLDIWCVVCLTASVICIFFLRPYYKRIAFEEQSMRNAHHENDDGTTYHDELE